MECSDLLGYYWYSCFVLDCSVSSVNYRKTECLFVENLSNVDMFTLLARTETSSLGGKPLDPQQTSVLYISPYLIVGNQILGHVKIFSFP